VAGLDQPHLLEQYWDMARATTLADFEAAVARLQMPFFNVVYADDEGHILFLYNARLPVRASGDWATWLATAPGDDPAALWTRTHDYGDLPRVLDPPTGWLQNANDPPWTSTVPAALEPADYPPYTAPQGMAMRPQRSSRMLEQDDRISFEELIEYKHSTRVELADRWLDDLVPMARASERPELSRAADALEGWDRHVDGDSRGAVLFVTFVDEIRQIHGTLGGAFEVPWNPDAPMETPDGLADPDGAMDALDRAAETVLSTHGSLDVSWGSVYRLVRDTLDLPANGAMDPLGVFRATGYEPIGDGRQAAVFGDSYVALIEFRSPLRAVGLLSYGNASQPGSPHRTDQLPLYSRQELRPVLRAREAVESHLESVTRF
jgi:acyl-homoserine-lactone acylase